MNKGREGGMEKVQRQEGRKEGKGVGGMEEGGRDGK